jgi:pyruvate dehydrogenase E2 component (dihydrolipoamide acetyltransferase)
MSESQPQQTPDFSAFGPVESRPLTRMQILVAAAMERSWTSIPHVSHQEEADITGLEALRLRHSEQTGTKISVLPFLVKAAVAALKQFPNVNASLDGAKKALILKQYYHIGIAIDVPAGLLVPVIRDADKKSIEEIGQEIADLAQLARTSKPFEASGGGIEWRTILPFSFSYDHRAVNGSLAGNFCRAFADHLAKSEQL